MNRLKRKPLSSNSIFKGLVDLGYVDEILINTILYIQAFFSTS